MFINIRIAGAAAGAIAAALLVSGNAGAQAYPFKPVRLIVPFAPGSATDISGRFIASQLSPILGQPVIIDNRPGADGSIGIMAAKNAPADGYTIVAAGWTNLTVNPVVMKELPYDPVKDLKPISGLTRSMLGLVVAGNSKYKTVADLVAEAKGSAKRLDFGTFSAGYRLAMEWFATASGVRFNNVPYKSAGQMNTDLMGNQIDAAVDAFASLAPLLRSGKLRVLAVTGERRHSEFREAPTVKESGYGDVFVYGWSAVYTRMETPEEATQKLADAMLQVMGSPAMQEFARGLGSELITGGPTAMRKFQLDQHQNFRRVAELAGIKPE
jgi:tripartite-type tricarboxylate transporter receptor subunit TctC